MKLFPRRSTRKIKSEINRINTEMEHLSGNGFMTEAELILWNDYNSILKGLEWVLKERNEL